MGPIVARELDRCTAPQAIGFDEFCATLSEGGVDLTHDEGVASAAALLARLYENRSFLADIALSELKAGCKSSRQDNPYGAQVMMLDRVSGSHFVRANFWPAADDPLLALSGLGHYAYHLPHDHNFDFVTVGYAGSGYRSRWYEYDYAKVAGYTDEPVDLIAVEEGALTPGRMLHYRAHRDVHDQHPPETLSISINIIPENLNALWLDQYHFDLDRRCLSQLPTIGQSEVALRIAAILSDDGLDLAHDFARHHPSERVRWQAWRALLASHADQRARAALMETAVSDDSALVSGEARGWLAALAGRMETGVGAD